MISSNLKELSVVKQLINEGEYEKATQILDDCGSDENQTLENLVACGVLRCHLLNRKSSYRESVKLSKQIYKESLRLKNLLSISS